MKVMVVYLTGVLKPVLMRKYSLDINGTAGFNRVTVTLCWGATKYYYNNNELHKSYKSQ